MQGCSPPPPKKRSRLGHNYIGTEHIFIASTKIEDGATAGSAAPRRAESAQVRNEIRREIGTGEGSLDEVLPITPRAEMVLSLAIFMADREESEEVDEAHVLLALLQEGEGVPIRKLIEMGFNVNLWLQRLLNEAYEKDLASPDENELFQLSDLDDFMGDDAFMQSSVEHDSRPNGRTPTPLLDKYGRDLTAQAVDWQELARRLRANAKSARSRGRWRAAKRIIRCCSAMPGSARRRSSRGWPTRFERHRAGVAAEQADRPD